jgi:hypothetical protein
MNDKLDPEVLFEGISSFIKESHDLVNRGAVMELAGLDENVRRLCEQVLNMTQDDRIRYADKLQQLLGELRQLGEILVQQRDAVSSEFSGATQHRKASVAYNTADATDGYGKKDG